MSGRTRHRRLNVLQRVALGYWLLALPMLVAAALVLVTVFTVQTRYVDPQNRVTDLGNAVSDLRLDLARQETRLRVLLAGGPSGGLTLPEVAEKQEELRQRVLEVREMSEEVPDLESRDAFVSAWTRFDEAALRALAIAAEPAADEDRRRFAEALAAESEDVVAVGTEFGAETDARYDEIDADMWVFVYATTGVAVGLIVIGGIFGFWLALLLPRAVARQLRSVVGSLSSATAEMMGVVAQVATTAVQTATAISQAATTVDEVRQTSLLASQKATAVADQAQHADEVAESGRQAVVETMEDITRIQQDMGVVNESIARMSEQSESVSDIMTTINDLAEQSALLSVNAAIEAVNAGEMGKGFGVVAEEIKGLAAASKHSVIQVRTILGDVQKATAAAVMASEQSNRAVGRGVEQAQGSAAAIEGLAESVSSAAQSATQIVASAQQQLVGMDQIAEAMNSIDEAGAQNAAGARELEATVRHVEEMADALQEMVATINPLAALLRRSAGQVGDGTTAGDEDDDGEPAEYGGHET